MDIEEKLMFEALNNQDSNKSILIEASDTIVSLRKELAKANQSTRAINYTPLEGCALCYGSGQYCIGNSGSENDGNAPILERCECYIDNQSTVLVNEVFTNSPVIKATENTLNGVF